VTDWQPIDTAPTDGTPVLLFSPGITSWRITGLPDVVVGMFTDQNGVRAWYSDAGEIEYYDWEGEGLKYEALRPTHWMPLPDPP